MSKDNKLGITDDAQLAKKEEEIAKKKNVELFEKGMLNKFKAGSSEALIKIHKYLFDEIYDCAGKLLSQDAKAELEKVNKMPQKNVEEIASKFIAVSNIQAFETGNGRTARIWLEVIIRKEFKSTIDWSHVNKEEYLDAVKNKNTDKLYDIIQSSMTSAIEDREVAVRSIDANFAFSGFNTYKTRVLG